MVKTEFKKKKRRWVSIVAPSLFKYEELGETLVSEVSSLVGRNVPINLADLTKSLKQQNIEIIFKIDSIKEDKANTTILSYRLLPSYLKRITRRIGSKIEESFECKTKDGIKIRIKPLLIIKTKLKSSLSKSLRKTTKIILSEMVTQSTFDELILSFIAFKLQKEIKFKLKSIYPVASCEIKVMQKVQ